MAISINMDVEYQLNKFPYLMIVGSRFRSCLGNGLPSQDSLDEIFAFSDSISNILEKKYPHRLAGYLTYQCMGFDVFYLKDTLGVREDLNTMIDINFIDRKDHISIRKDKDRRYYYEYLFPKSLDPMYLANQSYLHRLVLEGESLKGARTINHWMYFPKLNKRKSLEKKLTLLNFKLEKIHYNSELALPYELQISRKDSVNPKTINDLSNLLSIMCQSVGGSYDGWELAE